MNDFAQSVGAALSLIVHADPELLSIVTPSLRVSLSASTGAPRQTGSIPNCSNALSRLATRRTESVQDGAIPTMADKDAKRPHRERENLVGEQSRIVNRMKATLIRLGIRGFNPKLKRAAKRVEDLRTPDGEPIPRNTLAELRRDMARGRHVSDQIRQIEMFASSISYKQLTMNRTPCSTI